MNIVKKLALAAIASGLRVPENPVSRFLELLHLRGLLQRLEIDCVLDVGANRGQFAQELRGIGYLGHIVSFEPVSREFAILKRAFAGDPRWQGHQLALGSKAGEGRINVVPNLTVLSSLLAPIARQPNLEVEAIEVRRLDDVFAEVTAGIEHPRVFLKMDTQGYDLEVFKGATGCIGQVLGLQSELSVRPLYEGMPGYLESLSVYETGGFRLCNLSLVSRIENGSLQELNCFMAREA